MKIGTRRAAALVILCAASAILHAQSAGQAAPPGKVETGAINGAAFRIEVPANWNKGLVMYAHGYRLAGSTAWDPEAGPEKLLRGVFLSRGFAFAESGYSADGWAVKEGIEDTEALRRYFVAKYGRPTETYITGHSMGGHITIATIERYPEAYQGAMPMCGPLGPAIDFLNNGLFDMLVTFDALFPNTIGSPYEPSLTTAVKVKAAIEAQPDRAARYAHRFSRPVADLPGVLAFFQAIAGEIKKRAGGEPFDNRNRIYTGFGEDASLNRAVKRYTADPAARDYLREYATPTGRISDPVLAIHTTTDPLVLGTDVSAYEIQASLAGTNDRFVARFVEATGHCNFTPGQTGSAFDALVTWARDGTRPGAGEQK
jgi:pimeloyl-ACP methyl ester carboxylesterase